MNSGRATRSQTKKAFIEGFAQHSNPLVTSGRSFATWYAELLHFSTQLIIDNVPRLTQEYNESLLSLRRYFPEFYQGLVDAGSVYAKEAELPCVLKSEECDFQQFTDNYPGNTSYMFGSYKKFRSLIQTRNIQLNPVTPELIDAVMEAFGGRPLVSVPVESLVTDACEVYGYQSYEAINAFLRCVPDSHSHHDIPSAISRLLPGSLFPFKTDTELVVYRGDNMPISTKSLAVKGMLSTSLSFGITARYGDKRKLKIRMPAGTWFLPMIIFKDNFAEITLLPGTKLELVQKATSPDGTVFAEYEVTANPPPFTDEEVANILRDAIAMRVSGQLPTPLLSTENEQMQFLFDLVNEKYGGHR